MSEFPIAMLNLAGHGWSGGIVIFFALAIGHAVADFALQTEFIAVAKSRHSNLDRFFGGTKAPSGVWAYALGAHSLIHAGAVWLITGSVLFGGIEFILHAMIDYAKGENCTSFHSDQFLHLACKLIYSILIAIGFSWIFWSP